MKRAIIYRRVSTASQSASLELQDFLTNEFCNKHGYSVVANHVEVASGKDNDRPIYKQAIADALKHDCVIVSTKIDRLARRISAIGNLIDSGVQLRVVALGDQPINKMVLAVFAAMAEQEREFIAARTKAALAHLKSKGVKLGNPHVHEARAAANDARKRYASEYKENMLPIIRELQETGLTTLQQLADGLNRRGYTTRRGSQFRPTTVRRLLAA